MNIENFILAFKPHIASVSITEKIRGVLTAQYAQRRSKAES